MKHGLKRTLALITLTVMTAGYGLLAYHTAAMAVEEPLDRKSTRLNSSHT